MRRLGAALVVAAALAPAAHAATLQPNPSRFGDLVTATLTAPEGARVSSSFGPFAVRDARSTRVGSSRHYTWTLQCLDPRCAPEQGVLRVAFPAAHVGATLVAWPVVRIVPRATAAQVARVPGSFVRETRLGPPRYRVAPRTLELSAGLFALLAVAAAAFLLVPRRSAPVDTRTRLERALALLRAAASRSPADRRVALDYVARAVGEAPVSDGLRETAWSRSDPSAEDVVAAADGVARQ